MKGGGTHKLRAQKLSLTLLAFICLTLVIWAWEKTPALTNFLPPDQFEIESNEFPSVIPVRTLANQSVPAHKKESHLGIPSVPSLEENESGPSLEVLSSKPSVVDDFQDTIKSEWDVSLRSDTQGSSTDGSSGQTVAQDYLLATVRSDHELGIPSTAQTMEDLSGGSKDEDDQERPSLDVKECNYAKGKWVEDSKRPLYSGFGCKQWLSDMWACRLSQRTDFSYEKYRWQPSDCEMRNFEGSEFLRRMQHKTIAIVGDSLGRQQFQSLVCMVTGGEHYPYVEDIGHEYGLKRRPGAVRPDGWAYRFSKTNTTILYYWSATLTELEPMNRTDPATSIAMHLDRPATFLKQYLHGFDVLVLNTGHHWNRGKINGNRWVMYVNGIPNTNRKIAPVGNAKDLAVRSIIKWVDSQLPQHPKLKVFFRTISPRHFVNGDWNTGGSCDNTRALAGGSEVMQDEPSDSVVADAVKGTQVKILDITPLSQLRDEAHISKYGIRTHPGVYDCLHWCLPGIPDTWNEIMAAQV